MGKWYQPPDFRSSTVTQNLKLAIRVSDDKAGEKTLAEHRDQAIQQPVKGSVRGPDTSCEARFLDPFT